MSFCGGKHGVPFEFRWGSGDTSRVAAGESGLLSACSRNLGFFSSGFWKFRVCWRVAAAPETSSQSAVRNMFLWICSTGCRIALESWWGSWGSLRAWLVLRVPGDLWWGVLSSSLGATRL